MDTNKNEDISYSRDADQTRYIWIVGGIAFFTLLGLFILEILNMFSKIEQMLVFTPEIVHTLIPVTVGGLTAIGGFLFGRGVGERQARKNGGQS